MITNMDSQSEIRKHIDFVRLINQQILIETIKQIDRPIITESKGNLIKLFKIFLTNKDLFKATLPKLKKVTFFKNVNSRADLANVLKSLTPEEYKGAFKQFINQLSRNDRSAFIKGLFDGKDDLINRVLNNASNGKNSALKRLTNYYENLGLTKLEIAQQFSRATGRSGDEVANLIYNSTKKGGNLIRPGGSPAKQTTMGKLLDQLKPATRTRKITIPWKLIGIVASGGGLIWLLNKWGDDTEIVDPNGNPIDPTTPSGSQDTTTPSGSQESTTNIVAKDDVLPSKDEFVLPYPDDKNWKYICKNGNWYARSKVNGQIRNLSWGVKNGYPRWQISIDKLNKMYPNACKTTTVTPTGTTTNVATTGTTTGTTTDIRPQPQFIEKIPPRSVGVVPVPGGSEELQIKTKQPIEIEPSPINLTREFCKNLYSFIEKNDQDSGGRTATPKQLADVERCLEQYTIFKLVALKIRNRYGYTMSGGDKGIRRQRNKINK